MSTPEPESSIGFAWAEEVPFDERIGGFVASTATTHGDTRRTTASKRSPIRAISMLPSVCGAAPCDWAAAGVSSLGDKLTVSVPPKKAQQPRNRTTRARFIMGGFRKRGRDRQLGGGVSASWTLHCKARPAPALEKMI